MYSAAELILALQRRLRLVAPHLRRAPGTLPAGWQIWLEAMPARAGRVTGAPAAAIVAILRERPLRKPPRPLGELNNWQAFSTLWRQEWRAAEPEDRRWRLFAGAVTLLWHLLFGTLLVWLMFLRYEAAAPRGETVIQIELIGTGTPEDVGGGEAPAPAEPTAARESAPAEAATQARTDTASPAATPAEPSAKPDRSAPLPPQLMPEVVQQQPVPSPPQLAEQAVAVSEPVPDRSEEFVLTAPTPRIAAPVLPVPQLDAPVPSLQAVEIAAPLPTVTTDVATVRISPPTLPRSVPEIPERAVPAPLPRLAPLLRAAPALAAPQLPSTVPQVATTTIPAPGPRETPRADATADASAAASATTARSASAAASSPASTASAAPAAPSSPAAAAAAPSAGAAGDAALVGAGPKALPTPGGWPTLQRGEDAGDAARNLPGAQRGTDGLYNSDGSVRLPDAPGSASPGSAPGTVTEEIANLDRAGTWLKRPPIGYEPTAFDRYWRPNETLLAEWVRKSITTVRIPIPGTNKHIVCQTVLLALGGGCGVTDPDLNNQSASARPPPDIPFKPELQEDNGSIRPSPGS